jgi:hypothetical protein
MKSEGCSWHRYLNEGDGRRTIIPLIDIEHRRPPRIDHPVEKEERPPLSRD